MRLLLLNPNSSVAATAAMLAAGRRVLPHGASLDGATNAAGPGLISDEEALATAARAIAGAAGWADIAGADALIVAAFGDPGRDALARTAGRPVVGIAEAAFAEAGRGGRAVSVVTTTPRLEAAIRRSAASLGAAFRGCRFTEGDPLDLMASPGRLLDALRAACRLVVREDGAEAIVIGGGPLAEAADRLAAELSVPVIAPVPAAVRRAARVAGAEGSVLESRADEPRSSP